MECTRKRPRFDGSVGDIAHVVGPCASSLSGFHFDEDKNAKVSVSLIGKHWPMLTQLMGLMPTLSIKAEDLRNGMSAARAERSPDWPLQFRTQEESEWDQTMKKRLQIMMRHVAQAKLARSSWFVALTSAQDP